MKSMRTLMKITESAIGHRNDEFDYELAGSSKAKTAKGQYSKITATLKGTSSASFTRLAKKFKQINDLNKQIKELRDETNQETKDKIQYIFSAEDAAYTRYVNTVSLAITMTKDTDAITHDVIDVDRVAFINELFDVVDGSLLPIIKNLLQKHTHISQKTRVARQGTITVKLPEGIVGDVWSKIKAYASKVYKVTLLRLTNYDAELADIKTRFEDSI